MACCKMILSMILKSRKEHRRWERQRQVIRVGLITKIVLKQSLKGGKGVHHMSGENAIPAKKTASAKN